MRLFFAMFLVCMVMAVPLMAADGAGRPVSGRVVAIADGDTLTLLTPEKMRLEIRLAGIDAPESGQPYGREARQALTALVFGQDVRAFIVDTDRYGRAVAHIYKDELHINGALVDRGAAWVYHAYNDDQDLVIREERARAASAGLWQLPDDQRKPPWTWRHHMRTKAAAPDPVIIARERLAGAG